MIFPLSDLLSLYYVFLLGGRLCPISSPVAAGLLWAWFMVLGIGDLPVYFLLTVAAIWPILLNTAAGVNAVDRSWLTLARSLCATRGETVFQIILPAILSHLLTGFRLAIGIIWIVLVPAEMLGVSAGLGYYILDTRDRLAYSELMAVILVIGAIGYLLDWGLRLAHRSWTHQD